jgi:hypothetical protein
MMVSACGEDYVDVPHGSAPTTGNFYKTAQHAQDALIAAYGPLGWRGFHGNSFQFIYYALDDRVVHETSVFEMFIFKSTDGRVFSLYDDLYKGVYRCNILNQNLDGIPMDKKEKDLVKGQVHFLRGFYYFYLATLFNAPPLVTYANENPEATFKNTPQEKIYDFVESEFKKAADLLVWEWTGDDVGRATKGAALAMLGKTYLYQQVWDSAAIHLKTLIDEGPHDLMMPQGDNPDSLDYMYAYLCNFSPFNLSSGKNSYKAENNKESVFSVQFNDDYGGVIWNPAWQCDGSLFSAYFAPHGWQNVVPTKEFVQQFEAVSNHPSGVYEKDPRLYATVFSPGDTLDYWYPDKKDYYHQTFEDKVHNNSSITQGYGLKKYVYPLHFSNASAPWLDPNNWRVVRFADVLLMYAEAEYHVNGNSAEGLKALNRVRERAGMPAISELTKEAIIHERDVEFGFECIRFFDLVRWSKPDENGDVWANPEELITGYEKGKSEFLPIPNEEININQGKLQQNPRW